MEIRIQSAVNWTETYKSYAKSNIFSTDSMKPTQAHCVKGLRQWITYAVNLGRFYTVENASQKWSVLKIRIREQRAAHWRISAHLFDHGRFFAWREFTRLRIRDREEGRGKNGLVFVSQILYTQWRRKGAVLESSGGKNCLWESTPGPQDCQEKYGVCMALPSGCSWVPSVPYKNCIKEYQRKREQQRSRES